MYFLDEEAETSEEPGKKRRVVYGRDLLMNLKQAGSKDSPCITSIPAELIRDGKPSLNHAGGGGGGPGGVSGVSGSLFCERAF